METNNGSSNVYRIEPLKGADNYAVWKIKMMDILTDQGLWEYVDPGTAPSDTNQKPAWEKKDRTALSTIRLRVADKLLVYVASAKSSKDAWDTLKGLLEAQGPLGIVLARRKLFRAKCDDGTSIEDHIRTLRVYQEELQNLGQKIEDSEFSIILLTSLPDSWNNYISSIDSSALTNAPQLIARILEHDRRLKIQSTEDTALAAKWGKKKYNSKITCFGCGKRGHIQADCRSKSNDQSDGKHYKKSKFGGARANEVIDDFAFAGIDSSPDMAFISVPNDAWLADSACTSHISTQRSYFSEYAPISNHFVEGLGNQPVTGIGTVKLISNVDGKACTITLKDVLFVPKAPHNLISLGRVTSAKIQVLFTDKDVRFRAPNQTIMAKGTKISNLYLMDVKVSAKQDHTYSIKVSAHTWDEWHRIMGHLNMASIKQLKSKGMVTGMEVDESVPATEQCLVCILAKQHLTPYPQESKTEIAEIGDLTVSDLWGPAQTTGIGEEKYFAMFTDGKSQ